MGHNMEIALTRVDGVFLIGQTSGGLFIDPAIILHTPVQIQSLTGAAPGIGYQTSIVFLECHEFIPADAVITKLSRDDKLTQHYLAALEIYKSSSPTFTHSKH